MAGRETRLDTAMLEEATRAIRSGASLRITADSLGIPLKTVASWIRQGELARDCERPRCRDQHHGPRGEVSYELFATEVQKATGQAGLRAAASWSAGFQRDPYLAVRWLAKRYPDDFGARAELPQVSTDAVGPPLVITVESSASPPPDAPGVEPTADADGADDQRDAEDDG